MVKTDLIPRLRNFQHLGLGELKIDLEQVTDTHIFIRFSPVDDVYLKVHKAVGDQIDWVSHTT